MASSYAMNGTKAWLGISNPDETQLTLITLAVDNAENTIRKIRQQADTEEIEDIYKPLAVEMAVYLYEKRGVDGVTSFSENDITRVYGYGGFPYALLRRITPKPNLISE